MLNAIEVFLSAAIWNGPASVEALARGLDLLAVAYAEAPPGDPSDGQGEPSERNWELTYKSAGKRFPDLGYYGVPDPRKLTPEGWMVGDAIDDIADSIGGVSEVLWRQESIGPDAAFWHFKFEFEAHWGRHLQELAFFLHPKRFHTDD